MNKNNENIYYVLVNENKLQFIGESFDSENFDEIIIFKRYSVEEAKKLKKQLEGAMELYRKNKVLIYKVNEKIERTFELIEEK